MTSNTMHQNAIKVIYPYLSNGTWVFDDGATGLVREPFVMGMPAIINEATKNLDNPKNGFVAYFSSTPIPQCEVELDKVEAESGGTWYNWTAKAMKGWLCPALFKYFAEAPDKIYIKLESKIS